MEISKGMTGLKQAGRISRYRLTPNLARNCYSTLKHTPSLWHHYTSNLVFSLVFNHFGIEYTRKEDVYHLLKSLQED